MMFFLGVVTGIAVVIGTILIAGAWLIARAANPQRLDNAADEHTDRHGVGGQVGVGGVHFGSVK